MKTKYFLLFFFVCSSLLANPLTQIQELEALLSIEEGLKGQKNCFHILKQVNEASIVLEDDSVWKIGWWYTGVIQDWKKGDRLKLSYHSSYSNNTGIENVEKKAIAWGVCENPPAQLDKIDKLFRSAFSAQGGEEILLKNGMVFKGPRTAWKAQEAIFVFHAENNLYDLWNLTRGEISYGYELRAEKDSFSLEAKLTNRVLGQKEAIEAVAAPVMTYSAGLTDPKVPIAVFLFLGPTGVGKTELAKCLTDTLFPDRSYLLRFDMSHFAEPHTVSRLIGSPPGYVDSDKGGQLTEALRHRPRSIVLLDEMEKAHPVVRKFFLPVFDEGVLHDARNYKFPCNQVLFIMTSNICALEIAELFNKGQTADQVLQAIEPEVIAHLSPELYNRVVPIVFRPLGMESMRSLVDMMLVEITQRLKATKRIDLVVEESAKKYLIKHGFHPTLGARPLKRLIQKKVVTTLAYAIVNEGISDGSRLTLSYNEVKDTWSVSSK